MSWLRAIRKFNAAESQKAEDAVDAHIDPSVSLEMSIAEAQKNAEVLKHNAAKVLADREMAHMRLNKAMKNVGEAEANAKAALTNEQKLRAAGDDAGADRAHQQAVMMAQQVAHARESVATCQHLCEMADAAAATAQQRISEEMEALNEAMARRNEIQCLVPTTRVLTNDLRWVPVGEVKQGQTLVGFDEEPPGGSSRGRRWKTTEVVQSKTILLPCYQVSLGDGTVLVTSAQHKWLVRTGDRRSNWMTTEQLALRSDYHRPNAVKVIDVWEEDRSYESGYLAGFFDGDGSVCRTNATGGALLVSAGQRDNAALAMAEVCGVALGFDIRRYMGGAVGPGCREDGFVPTEDSPRMRHIHVRGGQRESLRFLGSVRPHRLLVRWEQELMGANCIGQMLMTNIAIVSIEDIGLRKVIALETTTGTLIAEGFAHHNSKIDQAKMEKAMNDSMASLTSANQNLVPSLDQVEQRAESMLAEAHATSGIQSEDPSVMALDVHHQAVVNSAEDILAELGSPADKPSLSAGASS